MLHDYQNIILLSRVSIIDGGGVAVAGAGNVCLSHLNNKETSITL